MPQKKYADGTTVSIERTIGEILATLKGYGCTTYAHAVEKGIHQILFVFSGLSYKMSVVPPREEDFATTESNRRRTAEAARNAYEQEYRRRARVLLISVKAKLEMCAIGGSSVEKEFLGDLMLPTGRTMSEWSAEELPKLCRGEEPKFTFMLKERNG